MSISRLTKTWGPSILHCVDCGTPLSMERTTVDEGQARCPSCVHLLDMDIAGLPTTAFLQSFERYGDEISRDGPSDSGLCKAWFDLETAQVVDCDAFASGRPLIGCTRKAHEEDDPDRHAWDARSIQGTLYEAELGPHTSRPLTPYKEKKS